MSAKELRKLMEAMDLTEDISDEERKFIMIMDWFNAASGMSEKQIAADRLKEKYPGVTPWQWVAGYNAYLNKRK